MSEMEAAYLSLLAAQGQGNQDLNALMQGISPFINY